MTFQTEFQFILPKGYLDDNCDLHREGTMRLATAADEILPIKDPRVQANSAYLPVIILSRVITSLGTLTMVTTRVIENLFASDFSYLQEFYNRINSSEQSQPQVVCPKCKHTFPVELNPKGEFLSIPSIISKK